MVKHPYQDRATKGVRSSSDSVNESHTIEQHSPGTGMRSLRKTTVSDGSLGDEAVRNPLARHVLDKMFRDPWRGGYTVRSNTGELASMARQLIDSVNLNKYLARCYVYEKVYGVSLLYMTLPGTPLSTDPGDVMSPSAVTKTKVPDDDAYIYDFSKLIKNVKSLSKKSIAKDPKYEEGEIVSWPLYTNPASTTGISAPKDIHANRVLHMKNWWLSDDPRGQSLLLSIYDALEDMENANVASIESFIKGSTGITSLHLPHEHAPTTGQLNDTVTQEDWEWAEANFKNIDVMKHMVLPRDWEIRVTDMNKGLNPTPYYDNIIKSIAAGSGIAKILLTGAEAGQLTGSEYVIRKYHELVADWRNELEEYILMFLTRFQDWGILPQGEIWLDWNPIDAPSSEQKAKTDQLRSMSMKNFFEGIQTAKGLGWQVVINDGKAYFAKQTRSGDRVQGFEIPDIMKPVLLDIDINTDQLEDISQVSPSQYADPDPSNLGDGLFPTSSAVPQDKVRMAREDKDKIIEVWDIDKLLDVLVPEYEMVLQEAMNYGVTRWLADFEDVATKSGLKDQYDPDVMLETLQGVSKIEFQSAKIMDAYTQMITDSLGSSWDQYMSIMGHNLEFQVGEPWSQEYITINSIPTTNQTYTAIQDKMVGAMREGLRKGESYQDIYNRIKGAGTKYTRDSPGRVVHKMCHEAVNKARIEAAVQSGDASKEKPLVYLTQGDNQVRPEHREREGNLYAPLLMEELLSEWGCRCTSVPSLSIERILGRSLTKTELGEPAAI